MENKTMSFIKYDKHLLVAVLLFGLNNAFAASSATATAGTDSSGNISCFAGEECTEAHAISGATAWADALAIAGPGSAKAMASATAINTGLQAADASAMVEIVGGGVLIRGGGGIGDRVTVRGKVVVESALDYGLSGIAGSNGSCCSINSFLSLRVALERKDPDVGYTGAADFEFEIADTYESVAPAINVPFTGTQAVSIVENGDGVLSPNAKGAYINADPITFAFTMGYDEEFRIRVGLEVSAKADASKNPGCVMYDPACVIDSTLEDNIAWITLDAGHSLYWVGMDATDEQGNQVGFVSKAGFDLSRSYIQPVPLPSTAMFFISGVSLVFGRRRKIVALSP